MSDTPETIAYCHACGAPMDVTAVAPFSNVECPKCGKHTRVKREFGPYTLLRRHAVGGMSMVFAAQDNTLNREIAVKILSEDYSADERRISAFEEEARITASFSHPHVVKVLRTGRAFGRFYIAMEFVPGGHFEHQIRERGKIPEAEMLQLGIEIAHGLKAAHNAGLIHRDVKPGNILLDAEGHAKLVDFGLALVTHGGTAQATELWATPYYVPPETVEGFSEDFRSDIYAFGSTLYHALAGKPPCGEESMATDLLREAKKKIIPLHAANPDITDETCRVITRAMAHKSDDRFSSYDELISSLTISLNHLQNGSFTTSRTSAKRRSDRKRKEMIAIIFSIVAVIAAMVIGIASSNRGKPAAHVAPPTPLVENPIPPVTTDRSAEIGKNYRDAHAAMVAKDYEKAINAFMPLLRDDAVQEPTRTWTGVQAVVAAYLLGNSVEARLLANEVLEHARSQPTSSISKELLEILEKLPQMEPLAVPYQDDSSAGGVSRVMVCMLAGLKNWEQGMLELAAKCFIAAEPVRLSADESSWASIYQPLASDYLADYQTLSGSVFTEIPSDTLGIQDAIRNLDALLSTLKTKGRAHFNVRAWQLDLARKAKLLEQTKLPDATKNTKPPDAIPQLADVIMELNRLSNECRFAEAVTYLKNLSQDPVGAKRTSLIAVCGLSANFLSEIEKDLAKGKYVEDVLLRSGEIINKLSLDSERGLIVISAGGQSRSCKWSELSPDALISLHRFSVAKNTQNEFERLRRNECAIAYDWLAGNRERSLAAAQKLSLTNPAFKQRWEEISSGLPK